MQKAVILETATTEKSLERMERLGSLQGGYSRTGEEGGMSVRYAKTPTPLPYTNQPIHTHPSHIQTNPYTHTPPSCHHSVLIKVRQTLLSRTLAGVALVSIGQSVRAVSHHVSHNGEQWVWGWLARGTLWGRGLRGRR